MIRYPCIREGQQSHKIEKCAGTPKYSFQQIDPKYSFHQFDPKYCFQQIERTGKSSDVLNIQWHFFKKSALGYSTLLLSAVAVHD